MKISQQSFSRRLFALGVSASGLLAFSVSPSRAQSSIYWNNSGANWNSPATWNTAADNSGSPGVWANGDGAIFATATVGAISFTLTNGGVTVDNITQATANRIRISSGTITPAGASMTIDVVTRASLEIPCFVWRLQSTWQTLDRMAQ